MFLRNGSRSRGQEAWGLVILGVVLCVVSVLGLTGAFGEISSAGRFDTIVLFGVPLGLFSIGAGIVTAFRGSRVAGDGDGDDPARTGDRSADPDAEGADVDTTDRDRPAPDGMIDR
ncbi:hypothetical protein [Clavibacter michiganensis]|uniref:hypothetical protein n=1 Tax=Clavibacter michiganensis TaxID=28447 RepID=UPI0005B9B9C7|nr:hypothetical protein [Clavibacter michiganensis]